MCRHETMFRTFESSITRRSQWSFDPIRKFLRDVSLSPSLALSSRSFPLLLDIQSSSDVCTSGNVSPFLPFSCRSTLLRRLLLGGRDLGQVDDKAQESVPSEDVALRTLRERLVGTEDEDEEAEATTLKGTRCPARSTRSCDGGEDRSSSCRFGSSSSLDVARATAGQSPYRVRGQLHRGPSPGSLRRPRGTAATEQRHQRMVYDHQLLAYPLHWTESHKYMPIIAIRSVET